MTGTVTASDADKDAITYKATTSTKGIVTITTGGVFTYTPTATARHAAAKVGVDSPVTTDAVTVTVTDSKGATATQVVSVAILPKNTVPTATTSAGTPNASTGVVTGTVTATDADGDVRIYTASTPAKGTVTITTTGAFTYTPTVTARHAAAKTGATAADKADSFTVTVTDGYGGSVVVPVSVAISPANTAPSSTITVGTPNVSTGVVTGTVAGADANSDVLSYAATTAPTKGAVTVNAATGAFTYTPTPTARHAAAKTGATTATKTDTFTITLADGYGGTQAVAVSVPVAPFNAAPVAGTTTINTPNATTGVITGTVVVTDGDKDAITYTASTPGKGSVTVTAAGAFTYTPTATARHATAKTGATIADKTDTFTITANDGFGGTVAIPVSVTLTPVNAAPTGTATVGTPNATTGVVTGTIKGADTNTDTLTYTASTPAKGTVSITPAGAFTYAPTVTARHAAAKTGATAGDKADTFTVTVTDGYGGSVAVPVSVPISPTNNAPTSTTTVGTPNASTGVVTGTVVGTDANSDVLSYTATTNPAKGAVTVNSSTGAFTYTPTAAARHAAAKTGATTAIKGDTFTVTVADGYGGTQAVAVSVPVTPSNAVPVAGSTTSGTPNATTGVITGTVAVSDADKDTITYTASTPGKGTVTVTTAGAFTYTPTATARHAAAKTGATTADKTDTFTVTATDGFGGTVAIPVTVTVTPVNAAPTGTATISTSNVTTGVVTGTVKGTDTNSDALAYTASTPAKGTVSITTTGAFTYTPTVTARHAAAKTGATAGDKADTFTVTVTDGYGGTVTIPINVAVGQFNTLPTATGAITAPDPVTGVVKGSVTASDADKDTLTYTASTAANGTVAVSPDGTFTYTPSAAARTSARSATTAKTDTFTITVTDGYGGTKAVTVTPTIVPSNSAPIAGTPTSTTNAANGVVTGTVNATDPDKDTLTYAAATTTTGKGSVTVTATGAFTYTPTVTARHAAAKTGATTADKTDTFTVTVTDKFGAATVIPVSVTVSPSNAQPMVGTTTVGTPDASTGAITGTVSSTDADKDTVTYSGSTTTSKGTVVVNGNGSFTYTPTSTARHAAAKSGATTADKTDNFTVTASDGYGGSTLLPVSVAIASVNANPVAGTPVMELPNASTGVLTGTVTATDADMDTLTYSGSATTSNGTVVVNPSGNFVYTPAVLARQTATGSTRDSFTVTITDAYGGVTTTVLSVPVLPINRIPVAGNNTVGTPNVTTGVVTGSVTANDPDGDALTYSGSASTAKGSVAVNANGTFVYTPNASARHAASALTATAVDKSDTFAITVADDKGGQITIPVTVTVRPKNTDPTAGDISGTADPASGVLTGKVIGIDPDGDALTYTANPIASNGGRITLDSKTGQFTYARSGRPDTVTSVLRNFKGPIDVVFSPDGARAFVSDGGIYSGGLGVVVIDTATGAKIATIDGISGAGVMSITPDGQRIYALASGPGLVSESVAVIDTGTNSLIGSISGFAGNALNSSIWDVKVSPDGTFAYVVDLWNKISVIDTATNQVAATITGLDTSGVGYTYSVVFSPDSKRAYVSTYDGLVVVDTATNAVVGKLRTGGAGSAAISPDGSRIFVAGLQKLYVLDSKLNVIASIPTTYSVGNLAMSPDGATLYAVLNNEVEMFDVASNSFFGAGKCAINNCGGPASNVVPSPDGSTVFVLGMNSGTVSIQTADPYEDYDTFLVTVNDGHGGTTTSAINVLLPPSN